ncbi:MAG: RDD family protein [Candidatus Eremiobacteraeota bacterium]|nr:RDD family protein [Candidatus Eremiobacteraeota bacterium]
MDRTLRVRTPESIAFSYELAGLGSRFLAVGLDLIFQLMCLLCLVIAASAASHEVRTLIRSAQLNGRIFESVLAGALIVAAFVILFGYFIAFEAMWNGQTPGKRAIGIRVVRDGGYPIGFTDSLIRNLIRVIEFAIGFYSMSAISTLVSKHNKRLGDLAAGTIVVRDRSYEVSDPRRWLQPAAEPVGIATLSSGSALTADEIALARRYVTRRTTLDQTAARELCARIAAALRPKLGPSAAALSDEELLAEIARAG